MTDVMHQIAVNAHPAFPVTIYYAFRSSETNESGTSSTGWETFLEAVIRAGFAITGTWPVRTELTGNLKKNWNALASSIVLVCHRREASAGTISRREFQRELRRELPDALDAMMGGSLGHSVVKPVDMAQSAIGPGMAIYSKYESVLNQDGSAMSVHDALKIINRTKDEVLGGVGAEDADTGFCIDWFDSTGWAAGKFGDADILAQAKGTSIPGVSEAGVIESGGGNVRLLRWAEYPKDWDPKVDNRMPIWEACHHLIRELNQNGEMGAGALLARMPDRGEQIRQLAYHLYTLCERKNWAEDARAYNELIGSWHAIVAASHEAGHREEQIGLEL
jgi:putative DNA methylase